MTRTDRLADLRQDAAYALRMLRRAPGFSLVAVATLALGIGANAAIFSVVHGVLLQSLPFRDADRLVRVGGLYRTAHRISLSSSDFASVRQDTRAFDRVEAYSIAPAVTMLGVGDPQEVQSVRVTDGLFEMLGLHVTTQGRPFRVERSTRTRAARPASRSSIMASGSRQFGGVPEIQGRTDHARGPVLSKSWVFLPREGSRLTSRADCTCRSSKTPRVQSHGQPRPAGLNFLR